MGLAVIDGQCTGVNSAVKNVVHLLPAAAAAAVVEVLLNEAVALDSCS